MARKLSVVATALAGVALLTATPGYALTWTCSTVALNKVLDPGGNPFKPKFDTPAINGQGDVVFLGKSAARTLYLYPGAGAGVIVAMDGSAAPGGGTFTKFEAPSINDAGDIGFFGDLAVGEGVFVKPSAGSIEKAALAAEAAPGGGTFSTFPAVSVINAAGDIAFTSKVDGGANGVFFFDRSGPAVSSIARVGDPTGTGRTFCDITLDAPPALSDSGNAAFVATTKVDCNDNLETDVLGIWQQNGGGLSEIAAIGGASPIAGSTYSRFYGGPLANAADKVLFRAGVGGSISTTGLFLFDPAGPSTAKLAAQGDAAPVLGGSLKKIVFPGGVTNTDRALFRSSVKQGTAGNGVFLFDTSTSEAVAVAGGLTPTDVFGVGSTYKKLNERTGVDRSGTRATFSAKIKDTIKPSGKTALLRCTGS